MRATSAPTVGSDGQVFFSKRTEAEGNPPREGLAVWRTGNWPAGGGIVGSSLLVSAERTAQYLDSTVQASSAQGARARSLDNANGFDISPMAAVRANLNLGQSTVSSMQAFQGSRVLSFGANNYCTMGDEVVCSDPKRGGTLWTHKLNGDLAKLGGFLGTSPAIAGGDLFVATITGQVLQLALKDGAVKATHEVGSPIRAQPAIVEGRIYIGTQDGKVVCVDTGNAELTGWSTWGGNAQHSH